MITEDHHSENSLQFTQRGIVSRSAEKTLLELNRLPSLGFDMVSARKALEDLVHIWGEHRGSRLSSQSSRCIDGKVFEALFVWAMLRSGVDSMIHQQVVARCVSDVSLDLLLWSKKGSGVAISVKTCLRERWQIADRTAMILKQRNLPLSHIQVTADAAEAIRLESKRGSGTKGPIGLDEVVFLDSEE